MMKQYNLNSGMPAVGNKVGQLFFRRYVPMFLLFLMVFLTGCKTSRKAESSMRPQEKRYLSSKVRLTIPTKEAVFTVNGTLKLISGERLQLSFLMPIIRSEVARMEVTPDRILLIDRMGKRYVQVTRDELKDLLPKKTDFSSLEKLLFEASKPHGKKTLNGKELGIPSLEKGMIELSEFSSAQFPLTPTEVSSKYTQVELRQILEMLMSL